MEVRVLGQIEAGNHDRPFLRHSVDAGERALTDSIVGQPLINDPGGHFYPVIDAARGRIAVTSRNAVTVYDIETGSQIGRTPPYQPIRVEYTDDGSQLIVASEDRVTVWNYDTDTWADVACEVAGGAATSRQRSGTSSVPAPSSTEPPAPNTRSRTDPGDCVNNLPTYPADCSRSRRSGDQVRTT